MFLELVRKAAEDDPVLAQAALAGLRRYQGAPALRPREERPIVATAVGASLRDCGGEGSPVILVPSLINPPHILDLDPDQSLAVALRPAGRVLLLDWGPASQRDALDLAGHNEHLLLPLLTQIGPATLVGYCLGGTLALAAASRCPLVRTVATIAAPWRFSAYPEEARATLRQLWQDSRDAARKLGGLPIEVLQAAFWSLDPQRTIAKFAQFGQLPEEAEDAARFVSLEEWANGGEALPLPAARELIEDLFGNDLPGQDCWRAGTLPSCPTLHVTADNDRIVPAASAAPGQTLRCRSGHVGMIVGREARQMLHAPLREWLEAHAPAR